MVGKSPMVPIIFSVIAICISLGTFGFSVYQSRDTQHEHRINAAIELSKMYLQDKEISDRYAMILNYDPKKARSNDEFLRERSFVDLINYIATLANQNLIDNHYLSWRIKCDIYFVGKIVAPNRPDLTNAVRESTRYVDEERAADCPERAPLN
jgi:hypothetical protein